MAGQAELYAEPPAAEPPGESQVDSQVDSATATPTPAVVLGLLAEPARLRVFAAIALGLSDTADVAARAGLDVPAALRALARLEGGSLVQSGPSGWTLRVDVIAAAAREAAGPRPAPEHLETGDPDTDAVLRAFLRGGRLVSIPSQRAKRLRLLEHLAILFEPGIRYPEGEVNAALEKVHGDYAALRRYLVDEGLLSRSAGFYWRTGGPVDI